MRCTSNPWGVGFGVIAYLVHTGLVLLREGDRGNPDFISKHL